jgi:hypothetical protein
MEANGIVSPASDAVSLTVPPEHFERFHAEVLFDLGSAGGNVDEACRWARDDEKPSDVRMESLIRVTTKELPKVHAVEEVWRQVDFAGVPDAATTVTGDRKVLRSIVAGCVLACGDDMAGAVQSRDTLGASRPAIAELAFWLDRLEEIGQEQPPREEVRS